MRTSWKTLAALAAGLVLVPQLASADEVAEQLKLMQERMAQLEDRLQATDDKLKVAEAQVNEQQVVIEEAGLAEERGAKSALSSFLAETEFSGAVAASYFYNTEDVAVPGGNGPISNPFHPNTNTFQLDEASLQMGRAADEGGKAGFQLDIMYGQTAAAFNPENGNGGNSLWVQQAYVEYNTGWLGDATVTMGKFNSHIGYEVANANANVNVTRGFLYNLLQPFDQIGLRVDGGAGGFSYMIGVVNSVAPAQVDTDRGKDLVASLGWGNDLISVSTNIEYGTSAEAIGGPGTSSNTKLIIVDFITELTPTDNLVAWLDLTYASMLRTGGKKDPYGVGVALGSRYAFNDKWGLGGRFEYGHFDQNMTGVGFAPVAADEIDLWSGTLTVDYMLADGLVLKVEGKYEIATNSKGGTNNIFPGNTPTEADSDQIIVGAQMVYSF